MGPTHGLPLTGPGLELLDVDADVAQPPWAAVGRASGRAPGSAAVEPATTAAAEPEGYMVAMDGGVRIHFLDWGRPTSAAPPDTAHGMAAAAPPAAAPGILLIHGLAQTAWSWAPIARRLREGAHVVAMDLRGHGLSDAPTDGYEPDQLAEDAIAVAEGAGVLAFAYDSNTPGTAGAPGSDVAATPGAAGAPGSDVAATPGAPNLAEAPGAPGSPDTARTPGDRPFVVAGHGYGAVVAAWTANALGDRCAGLVLVDGGWTDLPAETGMTADEWLAVIAEPPEVLLSMGAWLADRAAFDPATWDADQERAARAEVVETAAGRVKLAIHRHALAASVEALWTYDPASVLAAVEAQVVALAARDDDAGRHLGSLRETAAARAAAGRPPIRAASFPSLGHNLMRHVPDAVAAAILTAAGPGPGTAAGAGPGTAAGPEPGTAADPGGARAAGAGPGTAAGPGSHDEDAARDTSG